MRGDDCVFVEKAVVRSIVRGTKGQIPKWWERVEEGRSFGEEHHATAESSAGVLPCLKAWKAVEIYGVLGGMHTWASMGGGAYRGSHRGVIGQGCPPIKAVRDQVSVTFFF